MKSKYKPPLKSTLNSFENRQRMYVPIQSNESSLHEELATLKRINAQLKQKQQIYIDKLIKLEEGLEKQHLQFKKLQDLYNELFIGYKQKQEEIAQLEQHYRESDRSKYQPKDSERKKVEGFAEANLKHQINEKYSEISQLKKENQNKQQTIKELSEKIEKVLAEMNYYKNKDKMNDSRASLNSKVFEELEEYQRQIDSEKEINIKIKYENQFLKNRNEDLQTQIKQLQDIVTQKQIQNLKLRQNNISLHRKSSQNRQSRSPSRSPRKKEFELQKTQRILSQLHRQNQELKDQLEEVKGKRNEPVFDSQRNKDYIRTEEFFSFSREENLQPPTHNSNSDLQSLPAELQIENLIVSNSNKS